jgi:hypothetical protein
MTATSFSKIKKHSWVPFSLFLCFYLFFTLFTFKDYGIAADEPIWFEYGTYYVRHYRHHLPPDADSSRIFSEQQASHNYTYPGIQALITLRYPEKWHLINLLFGILGYWSVYLVLLKAYEKPWWAVLGPIFLFLIYRFSGDMPINPKDGPFAVLFILCLAWIFLSRREIKDLRWEAIVLGSLIGITTTVRAVAVTLAPILVLYRIYEYVLEKRARGKKANWREWVSLEWKNFCLIFFVSQFWILALWPYLGSNYFGNLLNVFVFSSHYPFDYHMPFMGKEISAMHLPWYYLPIWFGICLPLFILVFFVASPYFFLRKADTQPNRLYFLLGATFILHALMYFVLKPNICNSMRHYLFLVPLICVMATMALKGFFDGPFPKVLKKVTLGLVVLNVFLVLVEFVRLYPYQYTYFNELVGGLKGVGHRYETEYWSTNFREASLWLREYEATDPNKIYRIKVAGTPLQETEYFSPNMQGDPDMKDPDYEIWAWDPPAASLAKGAKVIHIVEREGAPFTYILKYERGS